MQRKSSSDDWSAHNFTMTIFKCQTDLEGDDNKITSMDREKVSISSFLYIRPNFKMYILGDAQEKICMLTKC